MKFCFTFVLVLYSSLILAENTQVLRANPNANPALNKIIDGILPKNDRSLRVGIIAGSASKSEVLYEKNGDDLMIPASVNKILTAYTALKKLKPTATFKTQVFVNGPIKDGKLMGDIYLKGGGDPSLVSERMWMLVNELIRSGIRTITGNLIADGSFFDTERTPESRPKYLKDQAYNAPIGALSFNFNTTTIFVRPGETPGQRPIVYTDPENSYIDVVNQASTSAAGSNNSIQVTRTSFVEGDLGDTVLLRGNIPADSKELRFYRNIVNPSLYTAHMFRTFWEQRGLKLEGKVEEGIAPKGAKQILEFESLPLWHVIWGMNKFSNNFVADQTLKKVGADLWGAPGTLQKGLLAIEDALSDLGISKGSYTVKDGSGLTRETKVTPRQLMRVLIAAHKDFGAGPEFVASMGIAGEDGTLRSRMPGFSGNVRAKTGSLEGVASLAGYCQLSDNDLLAFVILLNDTRFRYGRMTPWIDQIATAICKNLRR